MWALFDGDRERLNLAHECLDRHRARGDAICVQFADGRTERYRFDELSEWTSRFANWLHATGVGRGERVAVIADPSRAFYVGLFGAIKAGAIGVPLFTLFGPEGLALRINDCKPSLILTQGPTAALAAQFPGIRVVGLDDAFWQALAAQPPDFEPTTAAADLALFQYTSGTTRALPDAVRHTHRSIVTLMAAALYGVGLEQHDRYFCASSPAWGHGLAHGTLAPLALGVRTGTYSGKFDAARLFEALEAFEIDNFAAAPTVFRMLRASGLRERYRLDLAKISYSGEPMDPSTWDWVDSAFGVKPASMYGSTEVGVAIVNFPGFPDYQARRGALGKPCPGQKVAILDERDGELPPGTSGEIAVWRKNGWFRIKDRGSCDADGYFFIEGRSDDVIISAGWTMSAVEIENTLMKHPSVREAAVVGVADALRGLVAKAFIVSDDRVAESQIVDFMKTQLSQHEYPRQIEFVGELPKTPAGKIDRKALRERAASGQPSRDASSHNATQGRA
ncbi:MAG: acyl-CoA synthetase [Lautropia sp.]